MMQNKIDRNCCFALIEQPSNGLKQRLVILTCGSLQHANPPLLPRLHFHVSPLLHYLLESMMRSVITSKYSVLSRIHWW